MIKLGFFGGTFDPPHIGHLILASEGHYQLGLQQLDWILTPLPPHKKAEEITPAEIRLKMIQEVVEKDSQFQLSRIDLDRPAPHYTADTMEILRERLPGAEITYLVGEDSLRDLPNWHDPLRFLAHIDQLAVLERPGIITDIQKLDEELPGLKDLVTILKGPKLEISSSDIRRRIAAGRPYRFFVLEETFRTIETLGLYAAQQAE